MLRYSAGLLALVLIACEGGRSGVNSEGILTPPRAETPAPSGLWLAGDMHVHTDHSSDGSAFRQGADQYGPGNVSVADQIGQGVLNGLQWLPITDHRTYVQHYDPLWESADLLLIAGEEANGSPHANPIGAVDTIVQGAVPEGRPSWSRLQTSIWDAHSQGAAWSHNHPDSGHLNDDLTPNENANALGADVIEGWNGYSGIEREMNYAEDRWNAGLRFGVIGASDSHFRELWPLMAPGLPATRVFAPAATVRGVIDGLRAGHTTVTAGEIRAPKLSLSGDFDGDGIFEAMAGDEVVAAVGTTAVLRITLADALPTSRLHVYTPPGRLAGPQFLFDVTLPNESFDLEIEVGEDLSWYYAELRGPGEPQSFDADARSDPERLHGDQLFVDERRALSSPIFVGPRLAIPAPAEALPAEIRTDDHAQWVMGATESYAGFPDIAVAGGVSHVVAEQHDSGATRVMYRRGIDGELMDLAPGSRSARFPKVAARGDVVWTVWEDERASQQPRRPAIYARQSRDGGITWGTEILVREIDGRAEMPDLALLSDGSPVVVWQEIGPQRAFDVFVQNLTRDAEPRNLSGIGKTIQAANLLDTRSAVYPASVWPRIAAGPQDQLAVVFSDNRSDPDPNWSGSAFTGEEGATEFDNWEILITRFDGQAWSELKTLSSAEIADRHPDVSYSDAGQIVVAWDSKILRASGANLSIRSTYSMDNGQSWSEVSAVAENDQMMSQYPRLGPDGQGGVLGVWYDNRAADWRWKIMTARFDGGWDAGQLLAAPGINTWPATDRGRTVFASTRAARRLQRDLTQQIFVLP